MLAACQLTKSIFLGAHLLLRVSEEILYDIVLYQHTNVVCPK